MAGSPEKIHIESNAAGQFVEASFDRQSKQKHPWTIDPPYVYTSGFRGASSMILRQIMTSLGIL